MKLGLLADAASQWNRVQERGIEHVAGDVATSVHNMVTRTIIARETSSCNPKDTASGCQTPASLANTQTIAIALGAGIPLLCALAVMVWLHQRHVKKQKIEDANDPHKSLDFGMMDAQPAQSKWAKQRKGVPEMTVTDTSNGAVRPDMKNRQLSMDMSLGNPYLLPAEVSNSRGSIHSMSRSFHDDNDPYRPVAMLKSEIGPNGAFPGFARQHNDKSSTYSSAATSVQSGNEQSGLIKNAQRMSQSYPTRGQSQSPHDSLSSGEQPPRQMHSQAKSGPPSRKPSQGSDAPLPSIEEPGRALETFTPPPPPPPPTEKPSAARPPRTSSNAASARSASLPPRKDSAPTRKPVTSPIATSEAFKQTAPTLPQISIPTSEYDIDPSFIHVNPPAAEVPAAVPRLARPQMPQNRLSVMGTRPLPSDLPEDNPEIRANRIRSFYKEYFDDKKGAPAAQYQEDVDPAYLDGAIYDPSTGGFISTQRPFAQPVGRRAMTPPPRGARTPIGSDSYSPHRRHQSTQSARPGPRGRAQSMPKKRLAPPQPLKSLPTPHLLKDDTAIFNADDFAPPTTYRDRQAGRTPDSPRGVSRPYSPVVAAHNPLASAFDELSPMPSPHLLRNSSTFTALDFAAPPRFRGQDGASDAGSIRSNKSSLSAAQQSAIRSGAYRVSRLPTDMVASKNDLATQLKPSWDMRRGDNIMG
nr:hypothetical protein B0A51_12935 [Rachicladosporium sp. CCFEE 5018]